MKKTSRRCEVVKSNNKKTPSQNKRLPHPNYKQNKVLVVSRQKTTEEPRQPH